MNEQRENWSSSLGFIWAAAGSAVGLGNIWKFPYVTGQNGGGAFVLVYLLCIAVIGLPILLCEMALGRNTRQSPVGAFKQLAPAQSHSANLIAFMVSLGGICMLAFKAWGWGILALIIGALILRFRWVLVGVMGVLAGFVILSFYSVVAGWTIGYIFKAISGNLMFATVEEAKASFGSFAGNPFYAIGCHLLFMSLCIFIVYRGIQNGIEKWSKVLMPILFALLVVLIIRGLTLPGAMEGVRFYLSPDFSKITAKSFLAALGLAFFSLSLGMGVLITYGSYLQRSANLYRATLAVAGLDTLASLLAGLAIFPALFAMGFEPDLGPGLVFQVLPSVFAQMPLGPLWATFFFLLILVAALTSGISLLEVVTAYFIDEWRISRKKATVVFGILIFFLGCLSAVSVAGWGRLEYVKKIILVLFDRVPDSFFDLMDNFASNWLLPLGGLMISIFVGWIWGTRNAAEEIRQGADEFTDIHIGNLLAGLKGFSENNAEKPVMTLAVIWGIFIRFITPIGVTVAFLNAVGLI